MRVENEHLFLGEMRKQKPLSFLKDDEERGTEDATNSSEKHESKVIIIGGGIAGCAVACELARRGYAKNVLLLEKDESKSSRRQGYGLTISETNRAIEKLNIVNALKRGRVGVFRAAVSGVFIRIVVV